MLQQLITDNIDLWTSAETSRSTAGRGSNGKTELTGIKKLRELILELAVRGLLVPQDPNDEPASVLLEKIAAEKEALINAGKIKKPKSLPEITEDEKPFKLPDGWEWVRLGNIGNIFNGNSVNARLKEEKYSNLKEGLPFIATKDLGYGWEHLDYQNGILIPLNEPKFKIAHQGAVLICAEGGSAGKKCGVTRQDICFGNKLFALELHARIESDYILANYLSPIFFEQFNENMTGIIGGISASLFSQLLIPLPPLGEQYRIVAKVDELMALCDQLEQQQLEHSHTHHTLVTTLLDSLCQAADNNQFQTIWSQLATNFDTLFTTEASIDQLKQTILQLAVMGKLVPQDPNDQPASVLLEKIEAEKSQLIIDGKIKKKNSLPVITGDDKPFYLPIGWEWTRIDTLTHAERDISYGIIKLGKEPLEGGVPTLRCSDVKPRYIDLAGVRNVSPEIENSYQRTRLNGGEVLVNIRGTLGGIAVVPNYLAGYNIAREVAMLPLHKNVLGKFAVNVISSPFFWEMIERNLKGIAYRGLNLNILKEFSIPLPPLQEQHRIVAKVDELMALCDQLKHRLNQAKTTQQQLAHTIVQQAVA